METLNVEHIREAMVKAIGEQWGEGYTFDFDLPFKENGFDSLDTIELVMAIEDELDIDFPRNLDSFSDYAGTINDFPAHVLAKYDEADR